MPKTAPLPRPAALALALLLAAATAITATTATAQGTAPPAAAEPGAEAAAADATRPLSARGLANLTALTRLAGVVRWFHPADEAAGADWPRVLRDAVAQVEPAADDEELARRLEEVFRPLAPSLSIGERPAPRSVGAVAGPDRRRVAWHHFGLGGDSPRSIYRSERVVLPPPQPAGGWLQQNADAAPIAGRRARLRAAVRFEPAGEGAEAVLSWSAVPVTGATLPNGQPEHGPPVDLGRSSVEAGGWREVEIVAEVPARAEVATIQLALVGDGRAWLDAVAVERLADDGTASELPLLANPGFEDGPAGIEPIGWNLGTTSLAFAYALTASDEAPHAGRLAARLERRRDREALPEGPWRVDLGGGLAAWVPLSLAVDERGATLPRAEAAAAAAAEGGELDAGERASRLAVVATAWAALHHFYPYFDLTDPDGTRWPAALDAALARAATEPGPDGLRTTLRHLLAALDDGHGGVDPGAARLRRLPIAWDLVGGELVVTGAMPGVTAVAPGDAIVALDGVPVGEHLRRLGASVSAATPQFRTHRVLRELAAGPAGEEVELEVERGGERRTVRLRRIAPQWGPEAPAEPRPAPIAELEPGVWYVDLTRAGEAGFEVALPALAAADGVVFDLRGYPGALFASWIGHRVERPVSSARWRVPIVRRPDRAGLDHGFTNWTVEPAEPRIRGRVALLLDGRAISAAETVAAIADHYDAARTFGSATAGTNGNVNPTALPAGMAISWTGMRVDRHDGSRHHGVGVLPDEPVEPTRAGVAAGRDEVLEAAVAWIRSP